MSDSDTHKLLADLESGTQKPLADLFSRYREQLWRMVYYRLDQRLRGRLSPSDVLQDAYIDAMERVPHYLEKRQEMSFFVWLRLIVNQTLATLHRRHLGTQKRDARQEVAIQDDTSSAATSFSLASQLAASLTAPSQLIARAEMQSRLEAALRRMEPIDCEILALRHLEELGNDEAAEVLGLKKAAASNRYVRALRRLRDVLGDIPGYSENGGKAAP